MRTQPAMREQTTALRLDAHCASRRSRRSTRALAGGALGRRGDRARHSGLFAPSAALRRIAVAASDGVQLAACSSSSRWCAPAAHLSRDLPPPCSSARPPITCCGAATICGAVTQQAKAERRFATICCHRLRRHLPRSATCFIRPTRCACAPSTSTTRRRSPTRSSCAWRSTSWSAPCRRRRRRAVASLAPIARLFDIKEHWVALGCAASVALWLLSRKLHPKDERRVLPLYLGLAVVQCGTAWFGAIVGLVTASYRSVGGPL